MMKNRIFYFDFLRGLAIIGVIGIHTFGGESSNLSILLRQILNCSVPVFLAISGYFLANKDVSTLDKYWGFLKVQIPRVYLPMLIWSIPYLIFAVSDNISVIKSLVLFISGAYSIYYFIALIIQFYILLPIMQRLGNIRGVILSLLVTIGSMLLLFYLNNILKLSLPLIVYAGPFPVWMFFFVIGIFIGKKDSLYKPKISLFLTASIIGLILSFAETIFITRMNDNVISGVGIKTSAVIYSLSMILLLLGLHKYYKENKLTNLICRLGYYSFGIYLYHIFILTLFDQYYPLFNSNPWGFKMILALLFSYLLGIYLKKIHSDYSRVYLGVG